MSDTDSIKTFPILEKDLRDIPIARLLGCGAGSAAASLGRIRLCPPDVIQGIDVQQNVQWYAKRGDNADIIQVAWRNPCRRNLACQCYGQDLVGKMLEIVQETRRFLVITGGGVILLKKPLLDMLDAAEVAADRDYFLVNRDLASVLNSVGALFAVLFMAAKK